MPNRYSCHIYGYDEQTCVAKILKVFFRELLIEIEVMNLKARYHEKHVDIDQLKIFSAFNAWNVKYRNIESIVQWKLFSLD